MTIRTALVAAALICGLAGGHDWPQWGGRDPGRNMVSSETDLPASFDPGRKQVDGTGIDPATTKNVRWAARLGSYIYGNPTVADGKVFVGTDDTLLAGDGRFEALPFKTAIMHPKEQVQVVSGMHFYLCGGFG